MHLYDVEVGNLGANAVVGGRPPGIVGAALAFQMRSEPRVAVAFFGDGATNTGTFHESMNLAQLWRVPVVFVLENNGWAESTPATQQLPLPVDELGKRAHAYGMKLIEADGQDVEAVYLAALRGARARGLGEGAGARSTCARTGSPGTTSAIRRSIATRRSSTEARDDEDPIELLRARLELSERRARRDRRRGDRRGRGVGRVREGGHGSEAEDALEVRLCLRSSVTTRGGARRARARAARATSASS